MGHSFLLTWGAKYKQISKMKGYNFRERGDINKRVIFDDAKLLQPDE